MAQRAAALKASVRSSQYPQTQPRTLPQPDLSRSSSQKNCSLDSHPLLVDVCLPNLASKHTVQLTEAKAALSASALPVLTFNSFLHVPELFESNVRFHKPLCVSTPIPTGFDISVTPSLQPVYASTMIFLPWSSVRCSPLSVAGIPIHQHGFLLGCVTLALWKICLLS